MRDDHLGNTRFDPLRPMSLSNPMVIVPTVVTVSGERQAELPGSSFPVARSS